MSDEQKQPNGEPGEKKRPLYERILDSSEPADKTMGAIATVMKTCEVPAEKIIEVLGAVGHGIAQAKDNIDRVSDTRLERLVKNLRAGGNDGAGQGLSSEDAAAVVKHVLSCEMETRRMGMQFIQDLTDKAMEMCAGLVATVIKLGAGGSIEDILTGGFLGKLAGLDPSKLSPMGRAGAFGIGNDGQPNPPPQILRCGVCGKTFDPKLQEMRCPHTLRSASEGEEQGDAE